MAGEVKRRHPRIAHGITGPARERRRLVPANDNGSAGRPWRSHRLVFRVLFAVLFLVLVAVLARHI